MSGFRRVIAPTVSVDRAMLAWGLLLSILAAACGAGLLALSGWFLAMCAAAGSGLALSFSYLYPSGGVRGLAVGRVGTRYLERLVTHRISLDAVVAHRTRLFRSAGAATTRHELTSADLLGRLTSDVETVDSVLIRVLAPVVSTLAVAAGVVGLLALIDWRATVVAAAGATLLAVSAFRAAAQAVSHERRAAHELATFRARLIEWLSAAPELATYNLQELALAELSPAVRSIEVRRRQAGEKSASSQAFLVAGALALGVVNAAIVSAHVHGPTRIATLTAVAFASIALVELLQPLPQAWAAYGHIKDASDRLEVVGSIAEDVASRPAPPSRPSAMTGTQRATVTALSLEAVTFHRGSAGVQDVSLEVAAGETLIVAGPSGAGKTTLLQLLTGALSPQAGSVRIFGHDPATLDNARRAGLIVAVDQQPLHLTATVAQNLRIAKPEATDAELQRLLQAFRLDRNGALTLQDLVGDAGRGLSGGQRRRLAIARAVLKAPAVLVLDEPTEGLDDATATVTLAAVRELLPDATLVLVLHDRNDHQVNAPTAHRLRLEPAWAR